MVGQYLSGAAAVNNFDRTCPPTGKSVLPSITQMKNFHCQSSLAAIAAAILFSGCSKESVTTDSQSPLPLPPAVSAADPGVRGGRLMLSTVGTPVTFNPLAANDSASADICQLLFSSLVRMDFAAQEIRPGLAETWGVAPDGKTWTFKLRRGLRWSDGKPLTAADVTFTWNDVIFDPANPTPLAELFRIAGEKVAVTNADENTVTVVVPEIFASFLEFFGTVPVLPKHALEQAVREKLFSAAFNSATPPSQIVSSGPFRVRQLNKASTILERNPHYWVVDSKNQRLPYFDEVIFGAVSSASTQAELFLNGETMIHDFVRPEEFDRFQSLSKKNSFRVSDLPSGSDRDFICFNQNPGGRAILRRMFVAPVKLAWFRNAKFRQAISCAIDRERLAREVYSGRAQPAYDFISPENKKWFSTNSVHFAYDPAKAAAMLMELGFHHRSGDGFLEDTNGNAVEFNLISNSENAARNKAAALLIEMFAKVGIKMTFTAVPFQKLIEKVNADFNYDCALLGLGGGGGDPATSANVLQSAGPVHQWFPNQPTPATEWEARIDRLMDAQMATLNFSERKKSFDEVQAILGEQQPMIFTVSANSCAAISEKIGNVRPSAATPNRLTWNLEELYFKK